MSRGTYNPIRRAKNLPEIISFCNDRGLRYFWIAGNWHMRIEDKLDVYPLRKRYHWRPTDARGSYKDCDELGRIVFELMESSK